MVRTRRLKQLGVSQASLRVVSGPFQVVCRLPHSMAVSECLDAHMAWMVQPGIQKSHSLPRPGLGQHRTSLPPCSGTSTFKRREHKPYLLLGKWPHPRRTVGTGELTAVFGKRNLSYPKTRHVVEELGFKSRTSACRAHMLNRHAMQPPL